MTTTNKTIANTSNTEDAARILDLAFAATHGYVRGRHCDACGAIGDLVLSADLLLCACCVDRPTIETIADNVEIIRFATFGSLRVALYWATGERSFSVAALLDDGEWHADCPIRLIDFVSIDEREVADCWSKPDAELAIARFIEHRSEDS